jgi:hypothetical protein
MAVMASRVSPSSGTGDRNSTMDTNVISSIVAVISVYRPCCGSSTAFPDCIHSMLDFAAIDPHRVVSRDIFSLPGAPPMQQWLAGRGRLGQRQETGGACGV